MARQSTNLLVGLFVLLGVLIGVVAVIWVGATSYFQKGRTYVTYFDESVQGLQMDSSVKYRGVDVGRVEQIRVAPDNHLIAVVMKVDLREDLTKDTVAQMKAAGITGITFVDLDRIKPGEEKLSPKIDFPSEYPVIPSRPSEIQRIITGVNAMVEKLNEIDIKGISDNLKASTQEIQTVLSGKEMKSLLANLASTAHNLDQITGRMDKAMAGGKLEEVITEARETLNGARTFIAQVKDDLQAMKLPETVGQTRGLVRQVAAASDNLRRASETLEMFMERIYERPPDLLFGKPPRKRWNE